MTEEHASVREWTDILARVRFGTVKVSGKNITSSRIKAVAGRMANYADSDGSRVRPGIARLAVDLEIGYDTASRAVQHLARLGLLKLVKAGARPGHADVYQLAIPADLLDRVEVLTPAQHELEMEKVRDDNRGRYKPKPSISPDQLPLLPGGADTDTCTSPRDPQTPVDNSDLHLPQGPADTPTTDGPAPPSGTADHRPAPPPGSDLHLPPGGATDQGPRHNYDLPTHRDLRTDLTGPRVTHPEDPNPDLVAEGVNPDWRTLPAYGQLDPSQAARNATRAAATRAALTQAADTVTGPAPADRVWIAARRHGIQAHRLASSDFTACRRSTRTGDVLRADVLTAAGYDATWCKRCWPVPALRSA